MGDASLDTVIREATEDNDDGIAAGGMGYYGMYILGPMIKKFSENSIRSAEKLGGGLDRITRSFSSCRHPDRVAADEGGNDITLIGTRNRAFLDAVQARAPDMYGRFVAHSRAVVESDAVSDAQMPVAVANFYDPVAYFGGDASDEKSRWERARERNYRIMVPYLWMMYASRMKRASSSPDALRAYLDKEVQDAGTPIGRYSG